MAAPPLIAQTTYAELVERCAAAAFQDTFRGSGTFVAKTVRGRRYWYFQAPASAGRAQRYVGPETPEILERIAQYNAAGSDARERQQMVSALVRSYGMPRPIDEIGQVVMQLARAGVFRLRAVLVGTVAYQTYSAMLGIRLPAAAISTDDIDVAQFLNVSVAIGEQIPPALDVLRVVDPTFAPVPHTEDGRRSTSYRAKRGLRVDFLTPNEGPDTDEPQSLAALGTDAQPLRFLDFLIHAPEPAVVLYGEGAYVHVPSPERYAIHKLIVARRRRLGSAKSSKDLVQSQGLLAVLAQKRPHELRAVWEEAIGRGPKWREYILQSAALLAPSPRDQLLRAVGWTRDQLPGLQLSFDRAPPRYDSERDVVRFVVNDNGGAVRIEISREVLEDHFGAEGTSQSARLEIFRKNRPEIERLALKKYLSCPIEEPGVILLRTDNIEELRRNLAR